MFFTLNTEKAVRFSTNLRVGKQGEPFHQFSLFQVQEARRMAWGIPAVPLKVELGEKRAWRQRPRHIFQIAHPTFWLIQEAPGALVAKLKM